MRTSPYAFWSSNPDVLKFLVYKHFTVFSVIPKYFIYWNRICCFTSMITLILLVWQVHLFLSVNDIHSSQHLADICVLSQPWSLENSLFASHSFLYKLLWSVKWQLKIFHIWQPHLFKCKTIINFVVFYEWFFFSMNLSYFILIY